MCICLYLYMYACISVAPRRILEPLNGMGTQTMGPNILEQGF